MWDFDQETWIYIAIIAAAYFFYRSTRGKTTSRKTNRRAGFRERYNERRKEERRMDDKSPRPPKGEEKDKEN